LLSLTRKKDNIADGNIEPLGDPGVELENAPRRSIMTRQVDLNAKTQKPQQTVENELEGKQDMGGKQGGQAGFPKPTKRPHSTEGDEDVVPKRGERASGR
jgi:hypothetical protein